MPGDGDAAFRVGPLDLITDVPGVLVGNASDENIKTGTTVLTADRPFVASVDVMGGAPGTRETDCLAPDKLVDEVDAIVLSGGSAFGLDAASGVADALRARGRGYAVGPVRVPIVPAAILFDLLNGGASDWADNPYRALGVAALGAASTEFALGSIGAGTGATSASLKGGLGSASLLLPSGATVGALVAANPNGSAVEPGSGRFWAAPFEAGEEFGGRGVPTGAGGLALPRNLKFAAYRRALAERRRQAGDEPSGDLSGDSFDDLPDDPSEDGSSGSHHGLPGANTTLAIVATDLPLDKASLKRLAVAAQDGFARALVPSHTPIDGDVVFALSTCGGPGRDATGAGAGGVEAEAGADSPAMIAEIDERLLLGHAAALCVARAIARAVFEASPAPAGAPPDILPTWRARFG